MGAWPRLVFLRVHFQRTTKRVAAFFGEAKPQLRDPLLMEVHEYCGHYERMKCYLRCASSTYRLAHRLCGERTDDWLLIWMRWDFGVKGSRAFCFPR